MKTITKYFSVLALCFTATFSYGQQMQDTTMMVNGVCGMCQRVIETAAFSLEGVEKAAWSPETKVLELTYDAELVNLKQLSAAIAKSGYDTEYQTATEEDYLALHKCCYYRDPKVVEDHKKE